MTVLPPRVPTELADLDALIMLLGNRVKGELGPKPRQRLLDLCGSYPSVGLAQLWKTELKQIRKELVLELASQAPEADPDAG